MREGSNPNKIDNKIDIQTHHRVIMVVYIPHENDYYKQSFDVFVKSLHSLIVTHHNRSAITIVDNGSIAKVKQLLQKKFDEGQIDQLILHRENIGKIDAIVGAARGAREPLITLTDSDVLFTNSWQQAVEDVFVNIPKTGAVSPICMRYSSLHATTAVIKSIVTKKLRYFIESIPDNFMANQRFMQSVNWSPDMDEDETYPVIDHHGFRCIMGAPHQVITLRREIFFASVPFQPSFLRMGGESIVNYIDFPVDRLGFYRFSTYGSYAYHMGNRLESWMYDILDNTTKLPCSEVNQLNLPVIKSIKPYYFYSSYYRYFWRKIYKKFIGMNYQKFPNKLV